MSLIKNSVYLVPFVFSVKLCWCEVELENLSSASAGSVEMQSLRFYKQRVKNSCLK